MKRQNIRVGCAGIAAILAGLAYKANKKIVTTHYTYASDTLPDNLEGYTVLHLSDLHNTCFGKNQKKLIDIIERCQPDSIMITGDLIDCHRLQLAPVIALLRQALCIAPVYYVSGNHETWSGRYDHLVEVLVSLGVHVLNDEVVDLENGSMQLIGLQDRLIPDIEERLAKLMRPVVATHSFKILLSHRPEYFETYAKLPIQLVLTGHAHGGQIRLPYIGGLYAPGQGLLPQYTSGLYKKCGTTMVSNRGLGNSRFPLRLGNQPEVVTIKLIRGVTFKKK